MDTRVREKMSKRAWVYYDSFCQRYWDRKKLTWVKYPGLDCTYSSAEEAHDDQSLYKSEDTKLQRVHVADLMMALAA